MKRRNTFFAIAVFISSSAFAEQPDPSNILEKLSIQRARIHQMEQELEKSKQDLDEALNLLRNTVKQEGNQYLWVGSPSGLQGPQGERGPAGPQGPVGPQDSALTSKVNKLYDLMGKCQWLSNQTGKWEDYTSYKTYTACSNANQCGQGGGCYRWHLYR